VDPPLPWLELSHKIFRRLNCFKDRALKRLD
jgi:hypothetical protein